TSRPYPNPFTDQLWIPGLEGATLPTTVRIVNSFGQVVEYLIIPTAGATWNAEGRPDGIYFIQPITTTALPAATAVSRVIKTSSL
ncbi:MAG: T9SS type A sorting domain-containing protein, partial [Flavobacteriales bacterium]|nr:T9SS type A sorting domain-containing protein [Flavobacteriales bacterium]